MKEAGVKTKRTGIYAGHYIDYSETNWKSHYYFIFFEVDTLKRFEEKKTSVIYHSPKLFKGKKLTLGYGADKELILMADEKKAAYFKKPNNIIVVELETGEAAVTNKPIKMIQRIKRGTKRKDPEETMDKGRFCSRSCFMHWLNKGEIKSCCKNK